MRFRDRDAPVTREGLILRTYGYDHPANSCFCDLEYAPESIYRSDNPRALRDGGSVKYYKFYFDNGLRYIRESYPQYQIYHKALNRSLVGVEKEQLSRVVRPDVRLRELMSDQKDPLEAAASNVVNLVCDASSLRPSDFGVFGSLAQGFHNVVYSDLDLVIYGKKQVRELRAALESLYEENILRNEFDGWTTDMSPAHWNFTHYSKEDYGMHQRRKLIYALYPSKELGRAVKTEFEPVRRWSEIDNEYEKTVRIEDLGRVEAVLEVLSDEESGFMPSIYPVKLKEIDSEVDPRDIVRVVSYVEEFRLQIETNESALVRGNLERIETTGGQFYQITLSQSRDYFDQVLKKLPL